MDQKDIDAVIQAHSIYAKDPKKAVRKWDGKTPYYVHPLWCATMLATETSLKEEVREEGIMALLYHDVLEDSQKPLPHWLTPRVRYLVNEMTFRGGSAQEMREIWQKPKEVRLYKLYDKVNNLLDGSWMSDEKRQAYKEYTARLCDDVEQNFGRLNITRMAEIFAKE